MKIFYSLFIASFLCFAVLAQAPQKMSYQAVIRNASNNLVTSTTVGMQISILQGSSSGPAVYVETQTPMSNTNALVSIEIGGGAIVTGDFSSIDWSNGAYFVKTETDPTGGTSYSITGVTQLLSVPFALYAKNSDSWTVNADTTYTTKNVGIGTLSPSTAKLVIVTPAGLQGLDLSSSDSYANMRVIQNTNATADHDIYLGFGGDSTSSLHLYSNNSETMTIKNESVGVGVVNPIERLEVFGNLNLYGFLKFQGTNTIFGNPNDVYGNFRVLQNNSITQPDGMYINYNSSGSTTAHLRFYANGMTERMFIDATTGYVGINTTLPARTLHVNSVMRLEPTNVVPLTPSEGDIYMNSTTHKLMVYDGTTWQACW